VPPLTAGIAPGPASAGGSHARSKVPVPVPATLDGSTLIEREWWNLTNGFVEQGLRTIWFHNA
jgi:hypothetical protein